MNKHTIILAMVKFFLKRHETKNFIVDNNSVTIVFSDEIPIEEALYVMKRGAEMEKTTPPTSDPRMN